MNFVKILIMLCVFFDSSIINAEPLKGVQKNKLPLVAVGEYKQADANQPLILGSDHTGVQWSYVPVENTGSLKSVVCNDSQCIAIGEDKTNFPLLFSSNDAAHSWQVNKNISGLPANMQSPKLAVLNCVANICNATGSYRARFDDYSQSLPLLLRSDDYGQTWKFNQNITGLPDNFHLGSDLKISCSGQTCAAVGKNSFDSSSEQPLILISHDTGQSWTYIKKIENLPEDDHKQSLENVSCDGKNCAAVGVTWNSKARTANPIIVYSDNYGETWNYVKTIWGLVPAISPFTMMGATSINCQNSICIAGGSRAYPLASIFGNYPLLLESRDGGKTWCYKPVAVTTPSLKGKFTHIGAPSCAGSNCVLVGLHGDIPDINQQEYILASQNNGKSWSVIKKVEGASEDFMSKAHLSSASCFDDQCIIAGEYKAQDKYLPIFLVSKNGGMSWQLNQKISSLPQNTDFFLNGLTGGSGMFLK